MKNLTAFVLFYCMALISTGALGQVDLAPEISFTQFETESIEPGLVELSGASSDDVGIAQNRLVIRNRVWTTNKAVTRSSDF